MMYKEALEFFLNVSLNSLNLVTKIVVITVKGLKPATQQVRDQDATTVPSIHVSDRTFKLSPNHASLIFKFPEFAEFNKSSALFRKNSNIIPNSGGIYE